MNKHVRFFGSHQFNTMSTSYSVHELSLVLNALLLVAVSFLLLSRKNTPASAGTSETPNNKKSGLGPKASRPVLAASNANGKNNSKDQGARIGVIYSPFRRKSGCPRSVLLHPLVAPFHCRSFCPFQVICIISKTKQTARSGKDVQVDHQAG